MNTEFDKTVLLERIESLRQQVEELYKGIPTNLRWFRYSIRNLELAYEFLDRAALDLKFTPWEE